MVSEQIKAGILLFLIVLGILFSLFGMYGLWDMWITGDSYFKGKVTMKVSGYSCALVIGWVSAMYYSNRYTENRSKADLRKIYSLAPWKWRLDWLNGYSLLHKKNNMSFAFIWSAMTMPIIISVFNDIVELKLPDTFFWIFLVGFPVLTLSMLTHQLVAQLGYLLNSNLQLKFDTIPMKQGMHGGVTLNGRSAQLSKIISVQMKVILNDVWVKKHDSCNREDIELASEKWEISPYQDPKMQSIKFLGKIPEGFPDAENKIIIPEYSEDEGTIVYRFLIEQNGFIKKNKYNFEVPVFSSSSHSQMDMSSDRFNKNSNLAFNISLALALALSIAIYNANNMRSFRELKVSESFSRYIGLVQSRYNQHNKTKKNNSTSVVDLIPE